MKSLEEIIADRRTIKPERFTGDAVPDEAVWKILQSANWAPTHGFTEPWRFMVFSGEGKAKLLDFLNNLDAALNGPNEVRQQKRNTSFEKISHIIAIGLKRGENPKIPELEELLSVGMAVQNIWLSASNLGYGGYWSTGNLAYTDALREFIGLGEADRALGFFYLGTPIKDIPKGRRITPIEEKVTWVD